MKHAAVAAIALIASVVLATPAQAADSIDCVRKAAGADIVSGFENRIATGLIANNENALSQDWSTLRTALTTCTSKYKWSDTAANLATQFTLASIMNTAVRRVLVNSGSDPVVLTQLYRDLPVDVRRQFLDTTTIQAASLVYAKRMAARKISTTDSVNRQIGMLLGALAILEFRVEEFAAA